MSTTETKIETHLEQTSSAGQGEVTTLRLAKANVKTNIGPLSLIALGFNICNSWAGVSASLQVVILQGGPVTLLYGMFISTVANLSDALTLAELASVYPTAGGQYHFASILAPEKATLPLSYICGMFTMFSWIAIGAAVMIIPAQQIVALAAVYNPTYVPHAWHEFLIYQLMAVLVLLSNVFVLKKTPRLHDVGCKCIRSSSSSFHSVLTCSLLG
jgi:choline transport protein